MMILLKFCLNTIISIKSKKTNIITLTKLIMSLTSITFIPLTCNTYHNKINKIINVNNFDKNLYNYKNFSNNYPNFSLHSTIIAKKDDTTENTIPIEQKFQHPNIYIIFHRNSHKKSKIYKVNYKNTTTNNLEKVDYQEIHKIYYTKILYHN